MDSAVSVQRINFQWEYTDGTTTSMYVKDPNEITDWNELKTQIKEYRNYVVENQIFINKNGEQLANTDTALKDCSIYYATTRHLDLS